MNFPPFHLRKFYCKSTDCQTRRTERLRTSERNSLIISSLICKLGPPPDPGELIQKFWQAHYFKLFRAVSENLSFRNLRARTDGSKLKFLCAALSFRKNSLQFDYRKTERSDGIISGRAGITFVLG